MTASPDSVQARLRRERAAGLVVGTAPDGSTVALLCHGEGTLLVDPESLAWLVDHVHARIDRNGGVRPGAGLGSFSWTELKDLGAPVPPGI